MKVLDASAVLAVLRREPGHENVEFADNVLSLVNFAEVVTVLVRDGLDVTDLEISLVDLGLELKPLTPEVARKVGELYPITKSKGLSLGDRACLAVALSLGASAVTAESAWDGLEHGVEIEKIR